MSTAVRRLTELCKVTDIVGWADTVYTCSTYTTLARSMSPLDSLTITIAKRKSPITGPFSHTTNDTILRTTKSRVISRISKSMLEWSSFMVLQAGVSK